MALGLAKMPLVGGEGIERDFDFFAVLMEFGVLSKERTLLIFVDSILLGVEMDFVVAVDRCVGDGRKNTPDVDACEEGGVAISEAGGVAMGEAGGVAMGEAGGVFFSLLLEYWIWLGA